MSQPRIAALAADLMFGSRIRATAESLGVPVAMASGSRQLIGLAAQLQPDLIIVDLDTRALDIPVTIGALHEASPASEILAYVSHVRADAIESARAAGAKVLARSAFTRMLPDILRREPQA